MVDIYTVNLKCDNCRAENLHEEYVGTKIDLKKISEVKCDRCKCDNVFTRLTTNG